MDKIVCVGKNYADHVKEMGGVSLEKPILFLKPPSVLKAAKKPRDILEVNLPTGVGSIHHETEIVLKLGKSNAIEAVTIGLDMTLRDRQAEQKKKGQPWTTSKVFRNAAIVGPWIPLAEFKNYLDVEFQLLLNGEKKQSGMGANMLLAPQDCLQYIDSFFPLCEGDLIFTGTPSGVGPVVSGDRAEILWGKKLQYVVNFL